MQSILIDWQGGFVGSVANDLMWSIFPFLEANQDKKVKFIYSEKATKTSQSLLIVFGISKNIGEICSKFCGLSEYYIPKL